MLGFFSLVNNPKQVVKKDSIYFVSFPDYLSKKEIQIRFSKLAVEFANFFDTNIVYLNYGKENCIRYEFKV